MASLLTSRKLFLLLFLFTLIVLSISLSISRNVQAAGAAVVSGELKTWHKITLTWDGPNTSETANPNPFLDYRLDVTFSSGASTYTIPGYYCADGNAAETSATSGSKWCAHFAPDSSGTWNYTAAFTSGSKVAINGGGSSAGFFDGDSGSFSVAASDKSGNDFRGKGRAAYVGEHYLQHLGSGEYLIKCGADAPERAFDYEDFDATNGYFDWQEHQQDFSAAASPYTWQNGKGSELLGAIKYIQSTGCNAFSFLTFSLSGDSDSIAPHLDDSDGTPSFWNDVHPDRFDISKMSQWERIMQYADQEGVFLHFKTFEQENDHLMDWEERRLYYRMLIAAYSHHMALNWNLAEEISMGNNPDGTSEQTLIRSTLQYIADIDPYDHLRVFHTFGVDKNTKYGWFLGESYQGQALLSGTSLQTGIGSVAGDVRTWVEDSGSAGLKWVVANDEQNGAQTGVDSDDVAASRKLVREFVTWGTLMNGGAGTEFYYGYQTTFNGQSCSDLTCDNHRSRESKYLDAGIASQFFRDHLPYWQMAPMHSLSDNSNDWVYGKAGEVYALYLRDGGSTNITVSDSGPWRLDWFNPRTGVFVGATLNFNSATFNTGLPPSETDQDWTALIRRGDCGGPCPTATFTPTPTATNTPDPSATATNTPPPGDAVVSLTLINADSDQPVPGFDPIPDGATINLYELGLQNISVRANTSPSQVGSVVFNLDGSNVQTENVAPYALAGDSTGNFNPWSYSIGSHILLVTPYSGSNKSGTVGTPLTIQFQLVNTPPTATNTPLPATATPTATPSTGGVIWLENFNNLANGTSKDNGDTVWSSSRGRHQGSVQNGRFQVNKNGGEQIWMSEVINTSGAGSINISVQIESQGTLEASGQNRDYMEIYYRLDDGSEHLFFNLDGAVTLQQAMAANITSDSVQLIIRAKTTSSDEFYFWDDITVEGS